jgi:hypothetical protein
VERSLNFHGKSELSALRLIPRPSFQKKADRLVKQNESACHVKFEQSAWSTRSHMMSVSVFGVDSPSESDVASSAVLRNRRTLYLSALYLFLILHLIFLDYSHLFVHPFVLGNSIP